jgi:hypothetical protein
MFKNVVNGCGIRLGFRDRVHEYTLKIGLNQKPN